MPKSMPDTTQLLKAAVKYLENELLPSLDGYHRFKTRVTANALGTVYRELTLRAAREVDEQKRLIGLLGHEGTVEELSGELCEKIRAGAFALDDPRLREHIRKSLSDALEINNPKWLTR
jgi:Domain of unknown function (DUF6285)